MSLDTEHRNSLLQLARRSIDAGLQEMRWVPMSNVDVSPALAETRGSFVTLRILGQLRGCCGTLFADRSLAEDVWRNAWAAAFGDPRFSPLEAEEWPDAGIHISVLSPLEPLVVANESELLSILRPGVDGLLLERDDARATFLPDVWEQLSDPAEFLQHLKQKAGWPGSSWSAHIKVWRYVTESFGEREAQALEISDA
jgi:AmmeMemoRadiSam system protein A